MAGAHPADWSATAGSNSSVAGIDISEGCSPGNINDAIRAVMAGIKGLHYGGVSGGSANAQTVTLSPAPAALATGMLVLMMPGYANTASATLNANSLGAKTIHKAGSALTSGTLNTTTPVWLMYDGTYWNIVGSDQTAQAIANLIDADTTAEATLATALVGALTAANAQTLATKLNSDDTAKANFAGAGTLLLDEDNMASDANNRGATQQSIKAYVDGLVGVGKILAWAVFTASGTVTIVASGNVSSITDNGTGDFTMNFTNNLASTAYALVVQARRDNGSYPRPIEASQGNGAAYDPAVGSIRFQTYCNAAGTVEDPHTVWAAVYGAP